MSADNGRVYHGIFIFANLFRQRFQDACFASSVETGMIPI
jgi:hypothetical protein